MKKTLKKLMAIALSALLLTSFAACGSDTVETEQGEVDSSGKTIVKIMFHVDGSSKEGIAYKTRVDAFNTAYASENIKASPIFEARKAGATDYETYLGNLQVEGKLPDIITFDAPNCAAYAYSGLLYDISSLVSQADQADFYSVNKYGNKIYGLPIQESSAGFYYNKKIFADSNVDVSGVTVDNPWTFDRFKEVCEQIKSKCQKAAVDMRLADNKDEMATYLLYPVIYAAGGEYISSDGWTANGYFDSAKTVAGFQFIKDLVTAGYTSTAVTGTDFYNGQVGMYLSSGWTIPELDNNMAPAFTSRDDWGLLPYPKGEKAASANGSWCYGITANHHTDKTAIKKLFDWMTSKESTTVVTNATGMIPARRSATKQYTAGSAESVLAAQLETTGRARPDTVGYPKFSASFRDVISTIGTTNNLQERLTGKATELQTELNKLKKLS